MNRVNYRVTKDDDYLIKEIATRFLVLRPKHNHYQTRVELMLIAAHKNGCKLDLMRLWESEDTDFLHDLLGIDLHLNHETGSVSGFKPKCAA